MNATRGEVAAFFGKLALCYGLLIAPWPGLGMAYSRCFWHASNLIFGSLGDAGAVRFEEDEGHAKAPWTGRLLVANRARGSSSAHEFSSRPAYLSTALLAALILASPLSLRRRMRALCIGMLALHLLLAAWILLGLLNLFSGGALALFEPSPFWKKALALAVRATTATWETTFPIPLALWAVTCFRAEDFSRDPAR